MPSIAGIVCITAVPEKRHSGVLAVLLEALKHYGRERGWTAIEGYPFDAPTLARHGEALAWAGHPSGFMAAGFVRVDAHWMSRPEFGRSIFRVKL